MSNARTKPTYRPTRSSSQRGPWLWVALGGVVVLAAVVAVFASREVDSTSTVGIEETRSVEVNGTALAPLADDGTDTALGLPAPVLHGASFDGTPVTVGGSEEGMVIAFVAHWCPHCQAEVPLLSGHLTSNPMPAGVELLTVSTSTDKARPNYPPSEWLEREDWPGPVLADSEDGAAAEAFGLTGFPYFVAVDATGAVVGRLSGEITTDQFDQLTALALGTAE